jgi:hypothetical protein
MGDLDEILELSNDKKTLRKKIMNGLSLTKSEKIYDELEIINKRLMKLRNRN